MCNSIDYEKHKKIYEFINIFGAIFTIISIIYLLYFKLIVISLLLILPLVFFIYSYKRGLNLQGLDN